MVAASSNSFAWFAVPTGRYFVVGTMLTRRSSRGLRGWIVCIRSSMLYGIRCMYVYNCYCSCDVLYMCRSLFTSPVYITASHSNSNTIVCVVYRMMARIRASDVIVNSLVCSCTEYGTLERRARPFVACRTRSQPCVKVYSSIFVATWTRDRMITVLYINHTRNSSTSICFHRPHR